MWKFAKLPLYLTLVTKSYMFSIGEVTVAFVIGVGGISGPSQQMYSCIIPVVVFSYLATKFFGLLWHSVLMKLHVPSWKVCPSQIGLQFL